MLNGVLVIDKPGGMTSAAVVARVKRALGVERVGHTGTLDPMATGVLPLCLGQATKIAGYLLAEDKAYDAEIQLGVETDTLDAEGEVVARAPEAAQAITAEQLARALAEHVGPGAQIPPMYSAIKRGGKRLYELARAGRSVEREPRSIVIHGLTLHGLEGTRARFSVHCSKGTYIRSLAADLGRALGCGAHVTALRRTRAGAFGLEGSLQLDEITAQSARAVVIPPARAVPHLAAVTVPRDLVAGVAAGQKLPWSALTLADRPAPDEVTRLLLPGGELVALAQVDARGRLRYRRVFTYGLTKPRVSSTLSGSVTKTSLPLIAAPASGGAERRVPETERNAPPGSNRGSSPQAGK